MRAIKDLSQKERFVIGVAVMIPTAVLLASIIIATTGNKNIETEFKVFDLEYQTWGEQKGNTLVLTWGEGKFYFQGNWTAQFEFDHSYYVKYNIPWSSDRPFRDLIIIEYSEIE